MTAEHLHMTLGAMLVAVYAFARFNEPAHIRPTTTFARFWRARIAYVAAALVVYLVLGGILVSPVLAPGRSIVTERLVGLPPSATVPGTSTATTEPAPPGTAPADAQPAAAGSTTSGRASAASSTGTPASWLYAALLMTVLLPTAKGLSRLQARIESYFQTERGNIPREASVLAGHMHEAKLPLRAVARAVARRAPATFAQTMTELKVHTDWFEAPFGSMRYNWARVAVLRALVRSWCNAKEYGAYLAGRHARLSEIELEIEALGEVPVAAARSEAGQAGEPARPEDWAVPLGRKIDKLDKALCVFIAGGILATEYTFSSRNDRLKGIGFESVKPPAPVLSCTRWR